MLKWALIALGVLSSALFMGFNYNDTNEVNVDDHARCVYLVVAPNKEELKKREKIEQVASFVINDLSAGDSVTIDTLDETVLHVELNGDVATVNRQKSAFKQKLRDRLTHIKEPKDLEEHVNKSLARTFDSIRASHPSLLLLGAQTHVVRSTSFKQLKNLNIAFVALNAIDKEHITRLEKELDPFRLSLVRSEDYMTLEDILSF